MPKSGRGTCPVSKRSGVKLLYEYEIEGQKVHISKTARAMLENQRKREERATKKTEHNSVAQKAEKPKRIEKPGSTTDSPRKEKSKAPPVAATQEQDAPHKEAAQ